MQRSLFNIVMGRRHFNQRKQLKQRSRGVTVWVDWRGCGAEGGCPGWKSRHRSDNKGSVCNSKWFRLHFFYNKVEQKSHSIGNVEKDHRKQGDPLETLALFQTERWRGFVQKKVWQQGHDGKQEFGKYLINRTDRTCRMTGKYMHEYWWLMKRNWKRPKSQDQFMDLLQVIDWPVPPMTKFRRITKRFGKDKRPIFWMNRSKTGECEDHLEAMSTERWCHRHRRSWKNR